MTKTLRGLAHSRELSSSLLPFFDNLDSFAEAPEGVAKLRAFVLDLAVRGKLVEQDENDEPADSLIERLNKRRADLVARKEIKKTEPYPEISDDDHPHEIPARWLWVRIGELARLVEYGTSEKATGTSSDVPVLRMGNIQAGQVVLDNLKHVHDTIEDLPELYLESDDILFNRTNSWELVGKTGVFKGPSNSYTFASYLIRVRTFAEVDPDFVNLAMNAPYYRETQIIPTLTQQCGQANFNGTKMKHSLVPLPPLSEQRRIVSKVDGLMSLCDELESRGSERVRLRDRASRSCLDRLVSSRSRRDLSSAWQRLSDHFEVLYDTPETLAHLRQSILQLAVQGKLVPQDANDEPASDIADAIRREKHELAKKGEIKKTKRIEPVEPDKLPFVLPDKWEWVPAEDLTGPGRSIRYGIIKPGPDTPGGVPYVRIMEMKDGTIDVGSLRRCNNEHAAKFKDAKLRAGDLLISKDGTIGRVAFVPPELEGGNITQHVLRFSPAQHINRFYLALAIQSPLCQSWMKGETKGVALQGVNVMDFRRMPIPLPPVAEQKRIVAKVDQLLSQCDELSARLRERQSASQQLFTATIHHLLTRRNGDEDNYNDKSKEQQKRDRKQPRQQQNFPFSE